MVLITAIKQEKGEYNHISGENSAPDQYMPSPTQVKIEANVIADTEYFLESYVEVKKEDIDYSYPCYPEPSEQDFGITEDSDSLTCNLNVSSDYSEHECQICNEFFFNSNSLYQHNIKHLKLQLVPINYTNQCEICQSYFIDAKLLNEHIDRHELDGHNFNNEKMKVTEMLHQCNICGNVLKYKTWHSHMAEVHSNTKFICGICNREFKCKRYLRNHMRNEHVKKKDGGSDVVKCHTCPKVLRRTALTTHIRNCHSEKAECGICKSVLKSKRYLYAHLRRVHYFDGKEHICNCGKSFRSPRYLKVHIRNAHNGKEPVIKATLKPKIRIKCECGKLYSTKHSLQRHIDKFHRS